MESSRQPLGWKGILLSWIPALAWAFYINDLLSFPVTHPSHSWTWGWACNMGHAFLFGVWALLLLPPLALAGLSWDRAAPLAWLLCSTLAGAEELHQLGVPGRSASVLDFLTGSLGALLALRALWLFLVGDLPSRWDWLFLFLTFLSGTLASLGTNF